MCFICNLLCKCKCNFNNSFTCKKNFLNDHPENEQKSDQFNFKERYVDKILNDLDLTSSQMTIALTGEWGSGKTTLINLLQSAIKTRNQRNVVINFEPLIEGKLNVSEIISLFYLKLSKHIKNDKYKKYITACLTGLSITSNVKFMAKIGIPGFISLGATVDPNKSVKNIIKTYNEKTPMEFSEQAKMISEILANEKINLYVFIDEIDRLPEDQIINFLIFCRNIELIKNSVCFLGIDYQQVLWKLMHERFGVNSPDDQLRYRRARSYLDKLFQAKFIVNTDIYSLRDFFIKQLKDIDTNSCLIDLHQSHATNESSDDILNIICYLGTPRQIKKWLISIKNHYELIKYSHKHKISIVLFLAITVKHPIITDYLSRTTSNFLRYGAALPSHVENYYNISIEHDALVLASLGFFIMDKKEHVSENIIALMKKMDIHPLEDNIGAEYALKFLNIPSYLILLFIQGNKQYISIYSEYFEGDINFVLNALNNENSHEFRVLAQNLASDLYRGGIKPDQKPEINITNALWKNKANVYSLDNSYYETIILNSLRNHPVELVISECYLSISEAFIYDILFVCGVVNIQSEYNLNKATNPTKEKLIQKCLDDASYKGKFIREYQQGDSLLQDILNTWLMKFDDDFSSQDHSAFNQPKLISILYRYNQWSLSAKKIDSQVKLANYIINYLINSSIDSSNKLTLITALKNEINAYSKESVLGEGNPMGNLFGEKANEVLLLHNK